MTFDITICIHFVNLLSRSAADEEPLVNGAVNLLGRKLLVGRDRRKLVGADKVVGVLDSEVGANGNVSNCLLAVSMKFTYVETPPGGVLPVIRRSQASAHSRTTSMA